MGAEYKTWLDLSQNDGRATVAKAAIALANHGGGFLVLGFDEQGENLISAQKPEEIPEVTQDVVNAAIRRFATPEFHCEVHLIKSAASGAEHPVVCVPGDQTEPVMSKRDCNGVISRNRCYIRKPGPRSEEPQTSEEWRTLINRCVRASREDMLEAIRSIVSGRVDAIEPPPNIQAELTQFCTAANGRWQELSAALPENSPSRFPDGFFEMGFALIGNDPAQNLAEIQDRLQKARQVRMTGWGPFLDLNRQEWRPYPHDGMVEAWVGRPVEERLLAEEPAHADFWRVDRSGKLYSIRGYSEDGLKDTPAGRVIDVTLPVWRVGEATYFALRYAEQFEGVETIAIRVRFTGLNERTLTSVTGLRMMMDYRISQTDEVLLETTASLAQLRDNMVEVIHGLLTPLYEVFNFFPLSQALVEEELERMRQGRY
ncbi:helix-turn-helix domain-containing protein [Leisingera sp. D0M16]|uniref:AlbA family DNA-binding domain-containing protein n=1 Tax=Leisingera coralii TaxID=3351347 RepID=UPI003B7C2746